MARIRVRVRVRVNTVFCIKLTDQNCRQPSDSCQNQFHEI
jgi:hypothetical protein